MTTTEGNVIGIFLSEIFWIFSGLILGIRTRWCEKYVCDRCFFVFIKKRRERSVCSRGGSGQLLLMRTTIWKIGGVCG